jgi:hypothetical protein
MALHAVLTGDIVNSTKLKPKVETRLMAALSRILAPYPSEFYRGDSFQAYMEEPEKSLKTALLCRTTAISLSEDEELNRPDIRISIGIGKTNSPVKELRSAKGEAFLLSGRAFDQLQKEKTRLSISTAMPIADLGLGAMADHINAVYAEMTARQAKVIAELLQGKTQQTVAMDLKRSKSTIHQHVSSGRWPEIEKILEQFENLIHQLP